MLNIPNEVKELILQGTHKYFKVHFPNGDHEDITNENIVSESVQFTESLCSQDTLKFGLCEAATISFEAFGTGNIKGKIIDCSMGVNLHNTVFAKAITDEYGNSINVRFNPRTNKVDVQGLVYFPTTQPTVVEYVDLFEVNITAGDLTIYEDESQADSELIVVNPSRGYTLQLMADDTVLLETTANDPMASGTITKEQLQDVTKTYLRLKLQLHNNIVGGDTWSYSINKSLTPLPRSIFYVGEEDLFYVPYGRFYVDSCTRDSGNMQRRKINGIGVDNQIYDEVRNTYFFKSITAGKWFNNSRPLLIPLDFLRTSINPIGGNPEIYDTQTETPSTEYTDRTRYGFGDRDFFVDIYINSVQIPLCPVSSISYGVGMYIARMENLIVDVEDWGIVEDSAITDYVNTCADIINSLDSSTYTEANKQAAIEYLEAFLRNFNNNVCHLVQDTQGVYSEPPSFMYDNGEYEEYPREWSRTFLRGKKNLGNKRNIISVFGEKYYQSIEPEKTYTSGADGNSKIHAYCGWQVIIRDTVNGNSYTVDSFVNGISVKVTRLNKFLYRKYDSDNIGTWYTNSISSADRLDDFTDYITIPRTKQLTEYTYRNNGNTMSENSRTVYQVSDMEWLKDTRKVMEAFCELTGTFGYLDRTNGTWKNLKILDSEPYILSKSDYSKAWYDDAITRRYSAVTCKYQTSNGEEAQAKYEIVDLTTADVNGNLIYNAEEWQEYDLSDNLIIQNLTFTEAQIQSILENLANEIKDIVYMPADIDCIGIPFLEAGDTIEVETDEGTIDTVILRRTLSGIQALEDNYESRG